MKQEPVLQPTSDTLSGLIAALAEYGTESRYITPEVQILDDGFRLFATRWSEDGVVYLGEVAAELRTIDEVHRQLHSAGRFALVRWR